MTTTGQIIPSLADARQFQVAAARQNLARRRTQLRAGIRLHIGKWLELHTVWGPFPNPTAVWGMGNDGFPVILELNDPEAGALVCISDADQHALMGAVLLSAAFLNSPAAVSAYVLTDRPDRWAWAHQVPILVGVSRPGDDGLQRALDSAYRETRYLVVLADGDAAANALPSGLLQEGPSAGLWPLVFCSPQTGLALAARCSPLRWTAVVGAMHPPDVTPPIAARHPLLSILSGGDLQPGVWRAYFKKPRRTVDFTIPHL